MIPSFLDDFTCIEVSDIFVFFVEVANLKI